MKRPVDRHREAQRLAALHSLYDTGPLPVQALGRVCRLGARAFSVEVCAVSLLEEHAEWFVSSQGLALEKTPRVHALSAHTVQADGPLVIHDARLDARFSKSPLVTGRPHLAFYAGCPLRSREGHAIGTLFLADPAPRSLSADETDALLDLAGVAEQLLQNKPADPLQSAASPARPEMADVFSHLGVGIAIVSAQGEWLRVNPQLCHITGYSERELLGMRFQDITHADDLQDNLRYMHESFLIDKPSFTLEKRYHRKDGRLIWVSVCVSPVKDRNGHLLYQAAIIQDITLKKALEQRLIDANRLLEERSRELQSANEEIQARSITDELTGLYNRRGFYLLGEQALARLARQHGDCVLVYMDLDGLKRANDQGGHAAGDKLLISAAEVLKATCRSSDIIARLGGDEFCILVPDVNDDTVALASRLQRGIDDFNAAHPSDYPLAASLGVVRATLPGKVGLDDLLQQADYLMYERKRRKRERR